MKPSPVGFSKARRPLRSCFAAHPAWQNLVTLAMPWDVPWDVLFPRCAKGTSKIHILF